MRRDDAGFTIIELMVSAAVLALISVYLTGMLTQQNRAYTIVDSVTETQSNLRAVAALMERDIRTTGKLVREGGALCGVDRDDGPDVIYVTDSDAVRLVESPTQPGTFNVYGYNNEALLRSGSGISSTLRLNTLAIDNDATYDIDGDGDEDSDFREGGGVIVFDWQGQGRGTACGVIADGGVDVMGRNLDVDWEPEADQLGPGVAGAGSTLVAIPAHRYMVDDQNRLMRDDQVLAEDVEDLQLEYFIDRNDDGDVDPTEYPGSPGNPLYEADEIDHRSLREVRFNVVMRSRRPDPALQDATFQATANREAIAGTDGFRRRVITATVRTRNIGHRVSGLIDE